MTVYMLDTNICIAVMKGRPEVSSRVSGVSPDKIAVSGIVLAELSYGVRKSTQREQNEQALADFCSICSILDWPGQAAETYGEIRAELEAQGRIIGANDMLIAAHTRFINAVLVTNNTSEFERVPGLAVEDWIS